MKITIKSNAGGSFTVDPKTGEREENDCAGSESLSSAGAELPEEQDRD